MSRSPRNHNHKKRNSANYPVGRLSVNRRGFGFASTSDGEFYVSARDMGSAMHGDVVVVRPDSRRTGKGRSGTVVRVLERARSTVVGTYEKNGSLGIVTPIDSRLLHDIFVNAHETPSARSGDVVVARIETYPSRHQPAQGYIEELVGRADDPSIGVEVIIREHDLATEFSQGALKEAESAKLDVEHALREEGRRDIRDRYIFTIDPTDARDFDDAISLDWVDGQVRLGVHIADVSAYVPWDSSLDLDARNRATSVYLVDRVLPMLPESLSNGLCSLNPGEDRLAFTADMFLDKDGAVERYELYPSVIRSKDRFDYDSVDDMLDGIKPYPHTGEKRAEVENTLTAFAKIAHRIERRKHARGGLDFETVEAKVALTEDGIPTDVILRKKTQATSMIEEAMILANETVAAHMLRHGAPMIYRIHERPERDALELLTPILSEFDYPIKDLRDATPHAFQKVIAYAERRPEKYLINSLVLRAMKRARYEDYHDTHFGLASEAYTHFTSPIRRYPDLLVHRLLKAQLVGKLPSVALDAHSGEQAANKAGFTGDTSPKSGDPVLDDMLSNLDWLAEHSSEMEREAEAASYDSVMLKLCEYMAQFIGEEFDGLISGVVSFGLFVRLENTAEGLVHINAMGQGCAFDPAKQTLSVDSTGAFYRLGEPVRVRVENVSIGDRRIDFSLV